LSDCYSTKLGVDQDMSGNVWEWCLNDYSNPQIFDGYNNGDWKVLRGGSFNNDQYYAASSYRNSFHPFYGDYYLGLRLVVSAPIASLISVRTEGAPDL